MQSELMDICHLVSREFNLIADKYGSFCDIPDAGYASGFIGDMVRSAEQDMICFVAVLQDRDTIIGFNALDMTLSIHTVGPVAIASEYQSYGIGRRMVELSIDISHRLHPSRSIRLTQDAWNPGTLALYTMIGFRVLEPIAFMALEDASSHRKFQAVALQVVDALRDQYELKPMTHHHVDACDALAQSCLQVHVSHALQLKLDQQQQQQHHSSSSSSSSTTTASPSSPGHHDHDHEASSNSSCLRVLIRKSDGALVGFSTGFDDIDKLSCADSCEAMRMLMASVYVETTSSQHHHPHHHHLRWYMLVKTRCYGSFYRWLLLSGLKVKKQHMIMEYGEATDDAAVCVSNGCCTSTISGI
jgi:predicted N-acetyltransferase YhbS